MRIGILPDSYEIDQALQLTVEDDFQLFIKFDDLAGPIVKPDVELPSIAESCYISREKVFCNPNGINWALCGMIWPDEDRRYFW